MPQFGTAQRLGRVGQVGQGLVPTGDLPFVDDEGYLVVRDRRPAEIEPTIRDQPGVADVARAGNEVRGERVGAQPVDDRRLSVEAIKSPCQQRLARYKVLETIDLLPELAYDRFGKLSRAAIVQTIQTGKAARSTP